MSSGTAANFIFNMHDLFIMDKTHLGLELEKINASPKFSLWTTWW